MKKILLVGKLNTVMKETNKFLSQFFHVQLCSENASVLEGMLKIINPDLVIISLIGAYDIDTSIFFMLSDQYSKIPVLTIGTKEESEAFFKYYESRQFENLIRPVENTIIINPLLVFFISGQLFPSHIQAFRQVSLYFPSSLDLKNPNFSPLYSNSS